MNYFRTHKKLSTFLIISVPAVFLLRKWGKGG